MASGPFRQKGCRRRAPLGRRLVPRRRLPAVQERTLERAGRPAHLVQNVAQFGTLAIAVKTDMRKVRSRKQDMIDREVELHLGAYKSSGAEGEAQRNGIPARVAKLLMRNVFAHGGDRRDSRFHEGGG
jgi:hypothetical protein